MSNKRIINDKTINFKVPSKLYDTIKQGAYNSNLSMAAFIKVIFTEYIKANPDKFMPEPDNMEANHNEE